MLLFCWKPSKSSSLISEENLKSWLWFPRPSMTLTLHLYDFSSGRASPHAEKLWHTAPSVNSEHTKYALSSFLFLRFPLSRRPFRQRFAWLLPFSSAHFVRGRLLWWTRKILHPLQLVPLTFLTFLGRIWSFTCLFSLRTSILSQ